MTAAWDGRAPKPGRYWPETLDNRRSREPMLWTGYRWLRIGTPAELRPSEMIHNGYVGHGPRCEPPGEAVPADVEAEIVAARIVRGVAELPDRTSPEDNPMMMLVSEDELFDLLVPELAAHHLRGWKAGIEAAAERAAQERHNLEGSIAAYERGAVSASCNIEDAIRSLTPPKDAP